MRVVIFRRIFRRLSGQSTSVFLPPSSTPNRSPVATAPPTQAPVFLANKSEPVAKSSTSMSQKIATRSYPSIDPSPEQYARELLDWLRKNGHSRCLRYREILPLYAQMCGETGWRQRPWAPVARAFCKLTTGGKKVYGWYQHLETKQLVRRRIYPLPSGTVGTEVAAAKKADGGLPACESTPPTRQEE